MVGLLHKFSADSLRRDWKIDRVSLRLESRRLIEQGIPKETRSNPRDFYVSESKEEAETGKSEETRSQDYPGG